MKKLLIVSFICSCLYANAQHATQKRKLPYANHWSVVAGLTQPVFLNGVNVAVTYFTNRVTFEWSHGMFLNYPTSSLRGSDRNLTRLYSLYSTGPSVGYRITKNLALYGTLKAHRYEADFPDAQKAEYTNFDVGGGVYYRIYPFSRKKNALRGLVIEPSVRYWHNVASTLADGEIRYTAGGEVQVHRPHNIGLFGNVSVGYTFGGK